MPIERTYWNDQLVLFVSHLARLTTITRSMKLVSQQNGIRSYLSHNSLTHHPSDLLFGHLSSAAAPCRHLTGKVVKYPFFLSFTIENNGICKYSRSGVLRTFSGGRSARHFVMNSSPLTSRTKTHLENHLGQRCHGQGSIEERSQ